MINKKIKKIFIISILTIVLILVLGLSPLFNIKTLNIIGLTRYSEKVIIQKASIVFGQNWYRYLGFEPKDIITFSNSNASNEIKKSLPYIKQVTVKFVPLGKVRIRIIERTPKIAVRTKFGNHIIIDNEGVCLEMVKELTNFNVPVLENSKIKNVALGKVIEFGEPYLMDNIDTLFNLIDIADSNSESKLSSQITSFDFSSVSNTIIVLDSRIKVNLGDISKLNNYKFNFLKAVFFSKLRKEDKGSLDFSKEEKPIFVPE